MRRRSVYSDADATQLHVELSCVGEVSIATPMQLNSTQHRVELSCVGEVSTATLTQLDSTQLDVELSTRSQRIKPNVISFNHY